MGWFKKFVSNPVSAIGDVVDKTVHEVSNATSSIDDAVNENIPGGWATVALVAAGAYYAPEIGAYVSSEGAVLGATPTEAATTLGFTEGAGATTAGATGAGATAGATGTGLTTGATGTGLTAGATGTGLTGTTAAGLAEMGGAQGLVSNAATSNLAAMGGAQGLTTAGTGLTAGAVGAGGTALSGLTSGIAADATANAALGAGGAGVSADTLAGNLGKTGLVAGTGSLLGEGAASSPAAAAAAGAGTSLSSLLTPNNALLAKAVLDAIGGDKVAGSISDAAKIQQEAYEASKGDLSGLYSAQKGYQRPYMTTGANALNNINALSTGPYTQYDYKGKKIGTGEGSGYLQHQFDTADLYSGLAPNYDFMLRQGQMANQRAANVGGGALSGNTMTGLQRYTQDYAGNAYQNAFNNYQGQRNNIYNTLSNIAGIGQNATNALAKSSDAYGTNLTNLNVGNAAAQAASRVAAAQTQGNTLSNLANTGVLATLLNQQPAVAG